MKHAVPISKLIDYAGRWGIPVLPPQVKPPSRRVSKGPGPWSLATWNTNPRIYTNHTGIFQAVEIWPYLLHELAHAAVPMHPECVNEFSDTMGFEVLSIAHLGLDHAQYVEWFSKTWGPIHETDAPHGSAVSGQYWSQTPAWSREGVEEDAALLAIARGLFNEKREPTYRIARLRGRS